MHYHYSQVTPNKPSSFDNGGSWTKLATAEDEKDGTKGKYGPLEETDGEETNQMVRNLVLQGWWEERFFIVQA
jgi:hypothetical protein